jgi:hypothetical protein
MKRRKKTINRIVNPVFYPPVFSYFPLLCLQFFTLIVFSVLPVSAHKIAFLVPEKTSNSLTVQEKLKESLSQNFKVTDDSLAETVAASFSDFNIFNLSTEEAQNLGRAIGCDFFIVVKSDSYRRESLVKGAYFESYAVIYLVSSRTGRLVFWKLINFEALDESQSKKDLFDSIENLAAEIKDNIKAAGEKEINEIQRAQFQESPAENSPNAKNFRSPLPYRRIKPKYTALANLYGIAATVDALVDVNEEGKISNIEITRWAGFGLDESVASTIRQMQWRAAERDGKPLPIRVLLRYNFKKIEKDDQ